MTPRKPETFEAIRQEKRTLILDTALRLFAREGYHATTVGKLAREAGISKGLLYNYFDSKEEVLVALVENLTDIVLERLDLHPEAPLDKAGMVALIDKSINLTIENPNLWKLYLSMVFQMEVTTIIMERLMPKMEIYLQQVQKYFAGQGIRDTMAHVRYFSAVLDGIQMQLLMDPDHFPVEYAKQQLIQQFT